jgi:hypothetical protein
MVPVLAALTLIAFGIYGLPAAFEELKTGQAYSLAVVFGDGSKVQKDASPVAFWLNVGLHIFGFSMGIILGIGTLYGSVIDYKRKVADRTKGNKTDS